MFCSKCGNKLPKKSIYCNECGAKILVENIKKEKNTMILTTLLTKFMLKMIKILVNVLLVFKNIIKNSKDYISKNNQEEKKEMNIIVTCILVIVVSTMAIIGCLNGMQLLQIM